MEAEGGTDSRTAHIPTDMTEVNHETETGSIGHDQASEVPVSIISSGPVYPASLVPGALGGDAGDGAQPEKKDFESISLEEVKKPRRIIHFSDGVLEEYSTDEEDGEGEELAKAPPIDPKTLDWLPYMWYCMVKSGTTTYKVCDYLGEKLAYFFGITSPKYGYALSEYNRLEKEEKEELDRQMAEREEQKDLVTRQEAERVFQASMASQPEPGLPTSTH
ncbi:protein FAM177A1-like [Strongylocentrotus purpuratus]|uniref:Protein FAM177A1 n=1 Tax=Strongylocentrotus purpuratus TaxID=7668 RepID=A0A7M7PSA6_STRPU|nr:protein FAM177A1-like [Strongylocentrotus purpuratus]